MAIIVTQSSVRYFTNKLKVFVKLIVKLKNDQKNYELIHRKKIFLEVPPSDITTLPDINPKREEQIHPSR